MYITLTYKSYIIYIELDVTNSSVRKGIGLGRNVVGKRDPSSRGRDVVGRMLDGNEEMLGIAGDTHPTKLVGPYGEGGGSDPFICI